MNAPLKHVVTVADNKHYLLQALFDAARQGNLVIFSDIDKTLGAFNPGQHDGFDQDNELLGLVEKFGDHFVPVTGRPRTFINTLFGENYKPYCATEHGAIMYEAKTGDELISHRVPDIIDIRGKIEQLVSAYQGAQVELHKEATLTAEFTKVANALDLVAPKLETQIRKLLERDPKFSDVKLINGSVPGNCYIELVHQNVNKGNAVRFFMDNVDAFKGKKAVFLGDSMPDRDGMVAAKNMPAGGFALGVTNSAPDVSDFNVHSWKDTRKVLRALAAISPDRKMTL